MLSENQISGLNNLQNEIEITKLIIQIKYPGLNIILDEILPSGYEYWAGDMNEDGILVILDIILIINLIIDS